MTHSVLAIAWVAMAVLAACGPAPQGSPRSTVAPVGDPEETSTVESTGGTIGASEERAATLCVAALAESLEIPEAQIPVLETEVAKWSDTSLGCPQPGMMYAQVITPGFRVRM